MTFKPYPKYKASGVEWLGDVPEGWKVARLKHACLVFPSNVDKKVHDGEIAVRLCNYTDVYYNDVINYDLNFMAASATTEQIAKFTLRAGDTIITKDSETADDIAIAAYVPSDMPGIVCGYHLSMVRPIGGTCGAFMKRFFDSSYAKSSFAIRANGLTRVGLGQYALDNVEMALPPSDEQSAIAAFLDRETAKIDTLIAKQEAMIVLLKEKRQAVISHAVTKGLDSSVPMKASGVEWLGDVPEHWEIVPIKHAITSIEQGWSPQCEGAPAGPGEWGVLKVGCVNGGRFNPGQNKALPAELVALPDLALSRDDLLISRANTRELVGSAAVVMDDFPRLMLCDKLYRIRVDKNRCLSEFISLLLGTSVPRHHIELEASGASSSMVNIAQGTILELRIALPPIREQEIIILHVGRTATKIDTLIAKAHQAIALQKEHRTALISAAVTGKIDVSTQKEAREAA